MLLILDLSCFTRLGLHMSVYRVNRELALKRTPTGLFSEFEPAQNNVYIGHQARCLIHTVFLRKMSGRFEQETKLAYIAIFG